MLEERHQRGWYDIDADVDDDSYYNESVNSGDLDNIADAIENII